MNPLPRVLAMTLFVVLAALVALLATPIGLGRGHERAPDAGASARGTRPGETTAPETRAPATPARAVALAQRAALLLAIVGAGLAFGLVVALGLRARAADSHAPFTRAQGEIDTLAQLAATSAAQGAELDRERDVRRRAEEDGQLKQQLLTQSLDEKIRLGHDLHDGIIQSLYALGLSVETVRQLVHTDPAEAERQLEQMRAGLNTTIRDVRAYIVGLTPEALRRAGFAHAVSALLSELRAGREGEFEIQIDEGAAAQLSGAQSLELLQIAREAVSNALRHGAATHIVLRMHQSDREVCLLVQDNGRGFDPAARRAGGHGLGNMQARAARIGADLRIASQPGHGARIVATVPLAPAACV
jgi:signal transduction histidine kinase